MQSDRQAQEFPAQAGRPEDDAFPLGRSAQTRNLLLFAACTGLQYLASPVLYVGVQPALLDELEAPAAVSNLPATAYLAMTAMPVLVAWYFPYVSYLKRNLVRCYAAASAILAVVAAALMARVPPVVVIAVVIAQGAVCGVALPTAIALLWEVIGRGVAESRRGLTLSLAFGAGPFLAFFSSLASQLVLHGKLGPLGLSGLDYPWSFVILFGASAVLMALAAYLAGGVVVPLPREEAQREPFLSGVFGGLWDFLTDRVLLAATIVTILVYTGNTIATNMNLNTPNLLGGTAKDYAGLQLALRFGFKGAAGLLLGWLLTRTNPKAGLLVTASVFVSSLAWAWFVPGIWYHVAFGIYGAGELFGVYAPNYILSASRKSQIRRNMAFVTLMMAPAAPAGFLFGWIADSYGRTAQGFRTSFAVCAAIMAVGIATALVALPARPRPG